MIENASLNESVIRVLSAHHPKGKWVWKYTGPLDAEVIWFCTVCKRKEKHVIDLMRLHRASLRTLAEVVELRKLSDSFANHVCFKDVQQVIERLVQIILLCGHLWWESLDDSTKRFAMMELT